MSWKFKKGDKVCYFDGEWWINDTVASVSPDDNNEPIFILNTTDRQFRSYELYPRTKSGSKNKSGVSYGRAEIAAEMYTDNLYRVHPDEIHRILVALDKLAALAQLPPGWSLTHDEYLHRFEISSPPIRDVYEHVFTGTFEEVIAHLTVILDADAEGGAE